MRRVPLANDWLVSLDVSDLGRVAVGVQHPSHSAELAIFAARGPVTNVARSATNDAYRPFVTFFDGGRQVLSNERTGLFTFDVGRTP